MGTFNPLPPAGLQTCGDTLRSGRRRIHEITIARQDLSATHRVTARRSREDDSSMWAVSWLHAGSQLGLVTVETTLSVCVLISRFFHKRVGTGFRRNSVAGPFFKPSPPLSDLKGRSQPFYTRCARKNFKTRHGV